MTNLFEHTFPDRPHKQSITFTIMLPIVGLGGRRDVEVSSSPFFISVVNVSLPACAALH